MFTFTLLYPLIVSQMILELYQMDVKVDFLNGDIKEEFYMELPTSFENKDQEQKNIQIESLHRRIKKSL